MTDIATLGLAVDSSQVKGATTALAQLANAAKPAAQAAHDVADAHVSMSTQAMAAQHSIRSMIEGLAQGIPITQMMGMQMNHLAYAASGPGGITGAFKQAAGSLLGLLSPAALVLGGLAAVVGGSALLLHSIAETGKQFDDTARQADMTTQSLHALATAAAFKGIDNADFLKSMDKFAVDVYQAKNNMGGLAEVMRANGQSASTFNGYLEKAADLIKGAASDQQRLQLLQQMGLPATMDWVRFLSQGSAGIKDAIKSAAEFNSSAEGQLVAKARAFDEAWNTSWENFKNRSKSAILGAVEAMKQLSANTYALPPPTVDKAPAGVVTKGPDLAAPGAAPKVIDPAVLQRQISLQQQSIGLLGQMASAADAERQVELTVQAARLNGVTIDQKKVDKLKELAVAQSLGITAIRQQTDAENIATATVGMSVGQTAEYTAVQNALNAAKREGRPLTDANIAAIKAEGSALGQAAANADLMKFAFTDLTQGPLETFTAQIAQGAKAMDALKAAGQNALNAIAKKLADMAASNLFANAFGGSGGLLAMLGLGGATGAVNASGSITGAVGATSVGGAPLIAAGLHGGGGPGDAPTFTRTLPASLFNHAPRFHSGIGPGEQAAVIRKDESVLTPGQMGQLAPVGGGAQHVTVGIDMDANGSWKAHVKSVAQVAAAEGVNAFANSPAFPNHVAKASKTARSQRLL